MNITEFLEARIGEDEDLARTALVGMHGEHREASHYGDYVLGAERDSTPKQDEFITTWWPKRVLAECAAKRAIIEQHKSYVKEAAASVGIAFVGARGGQEVTGDAIRVLAAVYAAHPDYQQEWAHG